MLTLVVLASDATPDGPAAASRGAWTGTGLAEARRGQTATPLGDGRVLLVGGGPCEDRYRPGGSKSAEIFDGVSSQSRRIADLAVARREHSASLLAKGRVVVVGGVANAIDPVGATASVEVLELGSDPRGATATWTPGPPLRQARRSHATVILRSGELLVIGGLDERGAPLASTETWDGRAGAWKEGPPLQATRGRVQAHRLADGRVVVIGDGGIAELWTATTRRWRTLPPAGLAMPTSAREPWSSVSLPDGSIVAIGERADLRHAPDRYAVAVLNPRTETWTRVRTDPDPLGATGTTAVIGTDIVYVAGDKAAALSTTTWSWRQLEPPLSSLRGHTETTLADGRILVAGGQARRCDRAEILDPRALAPGHWAAGAPRGEVLTTLADGRVLLRTEARATQIWDPASGQLGPPAPTSVERRGHSVTLLRDGRVLVAGGTDPTREPPQIVTEKLEPERRSPDLLGSVEIFKPRANAWSAGKPLRQPRDGHMAALLPGGDVLVLGGYDLVYGPVPEPSGYAYMVSSECLSSVERWSPNGAGWRQGRAEPSPPCDRKLAVLGDGRVVVAGGRGGVTEVYDPARDRWTTSEPMQAPRDGYALAVLRDGRVLAAGGHPSLGRVTYEPELASAEVWTPATGRWTTVAPLNAPRTNAHAVLLPDGRVLVTGAGSNGGMVVPELWDPDLDRWTVTAAPPRALDATCQPWLLADGCVLLCDRTWCR